MYSLVEGEFIYNQTKLRKKNPKREKIATKNVAFSLSVNFSHKREE
jgi:hypothetical protein